MTFKNTRKILIIICLFISANAFANDAETYKKELNRCDEVSNKNAQKAMTTNDMKQAGYDLTRCYHNLAEKIIDKYYTRNSQEIKNRLDKFVNLSFDLNSDIYEKRDYCTPTCGTMYKVIYINQSAKTLNNVIMDMITAIRYNDI